MFTLRQYTDFSFKSIAKCSVLKGAGGGPDMIDHQNKFYAVFWKRGVRPTSCFLPDQKISFLAEVIAGQRSAPMCNSIVRAIFIRVYLKN